MNKVVLMGRLTKNPEIKYAGKDNDMAGFLLSALWILSIRPLLSRFFKEEDTWDFVDLRTLTISAVYLF